MISPLTDRSVGRFRLRGGYPCNTRKHFLPFRCSYGTSEPASRPSVHAFGVKTTACSQSSGQVTRREQLALLASLAGLGLVSRPPASAASPSYSLGPAAGAAEAIRRDFVDRQYYVTGDLSRELFAPDCVFKDPTVEVTGVEPYVKALQTLFDPTTSRADLISLAVTAPNTVVLRWRLEGSLKVGGLRIKPYTGTTVYTISDSGKVVRHEETWDISTLDAFVSTFFPSFGAPPAPPVTSSLTPGSE